MFIYSVFEKYTLSHDFNTRDDFSEVILNMYESFFLFFLDNIGDNDTVWNDVLPQRMWSCIETVDIFLQQSHEVLCSTVLIKENKHIDDKNNGLLKTIANILSVKDINSIEDDSFMSLGMDSLHYVEIKHILEINNDIHLSSGEIYSLTFAKLRSLALSNAEDSSEECDRKE